MAKSKPRRWQLVFWLLLWPLLFWFFWTPIPYTFLKFAALLTIGALWLGAWLLIPLGRWLYVCGLLAAVAVSLCPSRPIDSTELTSTYIDAMLRYKGTPYVWGGENGRGIDCSGLMRRGMIDALLSQGWKTENPALWREAAIIWWRDCSANEMKNGFGGRMKQCFTARRLNDLNDNRLAFGDLAVMASGVHVLACIDDNTWIQADPNVVNGGGKVIVTKVPSRSGWFGQRVVICRWKMLDGGG